MALHVQCPNGHPLRLGDALAGKRVRCPKCRQLFLVEIEEDDEEEERPPKKRPAAVVRKRRPRDEDEDDEPPAKKKKRRPADDEDDEDDAPGSKLTPLERRKLRVRDKKERLVRVHTGLMIAMIQLWIVNLLVLVFFVANNLVAIVAANGARPPADRDLAQEAIDAFNGTYNVFQYLLVIMLIAAPATGIVCSIFCLMAPKKAEVRGSAMSMLVFSVLPLIGALLIPIAFYNTFDLEQEKAVRFMTILKYGCGFFSLSALFMFILFLRQMSVYLQKSVCASESLNMLSWFMIIVVSGMGLTFGMPYIAGMFVGMVGGAVAMSFVKLIVLAWFSLFEYALFNGTMRIIKDLRKTIGLSTGLIEEESEEDEEDEEEEEDDEDDDEDDD